MLRTIEEAAQRRAWGHAEELLALVAELLDALLRAFIRANSDPNRPVSLPDPIHIPRPGREPTPAPTVSLGDLARQMLRGEP